METIRIKLADLVQNKGQIPGLPGNPRQWTKEDVDRIAKSLRETPELFDLRPCLVFPYGGQNIILGGNLRYEGARRNKDKDVPCAVIPADTPVEKLKEIVIKDNGSFGQWDYDALANEWDDLGLSQWGVPVEDVEKQLKKLKKEEEKLGLVPFTEVLGEEHNYIVLFFDNEVDWLQAQTLFDIKPVKALPTKRGGEQSIAFQKRIGVGRVINGAKAINKLLDNKGEGQ